MDETHDNSAVAATVAELQLFNHRKAADMMGDLWWSLQRAEALVHDIAAAIDRDGGQTQGGDANMLATATRVIERLATERSESEVREHLARSERNQALARLDALTLAAQTLVDAIGGAGTAADDQLLDLKEALSGANVNEACGKEGE